MTHDDKRFALFLSSIGLALALLFAGFCYDLGMHGTFAAFGMIALIFLVAVFCLHQSLQK